LLFAVFAVMSASGPSDSESTSNQISDSYNSTTNKTVTLSDVGNNTLSFNITQPGLDGLPSMSTILPIAAGLALIGAFFLFNRCSQARRASANGSSGQQSRSSASLSSRK